ncbi:MAG: glutamyl-tRNA reductase [Armatimonadetes bacterium]|nr:glutamyl-tRNA reductase [Armatimonadota bacterium]
MHLVVIGLNHKTAPVEVREKLAVSETHLPEALEVLSRCGCVAECCILSTCNRTEIYAVTAKHDDEEVLIDFISSYHAIDREGFQEYLYRHRGHKAVQHLFAVAAGIDSMMVGETQILGQVKNAFCVADGVDSTKAVLNNLFQQALNVGKRARSQTDISRGAFSVGYAAVELAKLIFGNLQGHKILILGAGKMSELTAKHMLSSGATTVMVANRTLSRAEELAKRLGGRAVPFDSFPEAIVEADIVIGSTGSREPIIRRDQMIKIMRQRREKPIFLIDIAVPRDVEAGVGDLDNIFLYNIDDLEQMVQQSIAEREKEIEKVWEIVAEETHRFAAWMRTLEAVPLIKLIRNKLDGIKDAEWERYGNKLSHLPENDQETVKVMMQSLVNKITHNPLIKIKEYATSGNGYDKMEIARELFGIEVDAEEETDVSGGQAGPADAEDTKA